MAHLPDLPTPSTQQPVDESALGPACVLSFNASDPSGAGGLAADISTICAMGAHPLPVVTSVLLRDTAEVFDAQAIDADCVIEQARSILEDVSISACKVGFLGNAEGVSAAAEILSDYSEAPLVAYWPTLSWMQDDELQQYTDAFRELILPSTQLLVGNLTALSELLLPEWEAERPPSARELAVAAAEHGCSYVLVTSMPLPEHFIDNVLASPNGAITGERFERFEASFIGAGDTLSAAVTALLAEGGELHVAVGEALNFLDQALDAGFRPGMGQVIPDRFFWALPPAEEGAEAGEPGPESTETAAAPEVKNTKHLH